MSRVRLFYLLGFALVGCAGKTTPSSGSPATESDAGVSDGGGPSVQLSPPTNHRATGVSCSPTPVGPEPSLPDAGPTFTCATNEDCTAHPGGRCIYDSGQCGEPCAQTQPGSTCEYDACADDNDCPKDSACSCGSGGAATNSCGAAGDCRVDADCASGYCSPSTDECGTFNGYYCHTVSDTCTNDSDCSSLGLFGKCVAGGTPSTWGCSNVGCAAGGSAM